MACPFLPQLLVSMPSVSESLQLWEEAGAASVTSFANWVSTPCHPSVFRENLKFPNTQPLLSTKPLETQIFHEITQYQLV